MKWSTDRTRTLALGAGAIVALFAAGFALPGATGGFLAASGALPHGVCFAWDSGLLWSHVVSDALIAASYFSIPVALVLFVRRRRDIPFPGLFLLFGLFIVSCGLTHVIDVWTLWHPDYWLSAAARALTALSSVPTAIATVWLLPKALRIPSAEELRVTNERLRAEIEARRGAEAQLLEAKAELEARVRSRTREVASAHAVMSTLVDKAPIGLALFDRERRFVRVNEALAAMNGLPPPAHLGRALTEVLPAMDPGVDASLETVVRTGESLIDREAHGRTPARPDEDRWWSVSYYPVRVDDEIIGVGAVCEETTAKKRIEAERAALLERAQEARREAEAASRSKDEFLAAVSHELRNPLQGMLGWVQLLERGALDPVAARVAAERLGVAARAQARLIEDLLDASRIVTGKLQLQREHVNLREIVESATDALREEAMRKGVALRAGGGDRPCPLYADPLRLRQVVWNLLSNAVKFTPAGKSVEVSVDCSGTAARITVADEGIGIPEDFLPRIFEPFSQAAPGAGAGGLGLGLAIARQIVEQHGGEIRVARTALGGGTTFVAALQAASAPGEKAAAPRTAADALRGICVLVVDDDPHAIEPLGALLQGFGAHVLLADSARHARERLAQHAVDVLVSDLGMPDEDGFALIESVRADAGHARLPAVALSAYARPEDRTHALAAGFDMHLAKPVEIDELVAAIRGLAGRRLAMRQPAS